MSFFPKSGMVNVKMVITEEKILSNIDKIQKLINPNSKKQIVKLEEDTYFKDLVESVKTYLIEYPAKNSFPASIYKATYELVEYATNQFEENTKKVEELIRNRERNIKLANVLRDVLKAIEGKSKNSKEIIKKVKKKYPEEIGEALKVILVSDKNSEEYHDAEKTVNAKINNLESNMFIEIDMERIEDKSKALSYIGIEIAEALRYIPAPSQDAVGAQNKEIEVQEQKTTSQLLQEVINNNEVDEVDEASEFFAETRFETKPSFWQRIKESKVIRKLKYIMQIRVVLDYPALPEGRGE